MHCVAVRVIYSARCVNGGAVGMVIDKSELEVSARSTFTAQLDGDDAECYKRGTETAGSARKTVWMLRLQDARPIFPILSSKITGKHLRNSRRQAKT